MVSFIPNWNRIMVGLKKNWKPSFIQAGPELKTMAVPRRIFIFKFRAI
jgi:hypothetical protein